MNTIKSNYFKALYITIGLFLLFAGCENNDDEVSPSDKQLYVFYPTVGGFSCSPPTLVNNNIYIGTSTNLTYVPPSENYFYKLDEKLNKIWEYSLGNKQLRGAASLDSYGNIYFVADSGRTTTNGNAPVQLYSIDNNGHFRWSRSIGEFDLEAGMRSIAIAEDNTVYVGGDIFYAFDINGNIKWTYNDGMVSASHNAPIIDPEGNIYFAANGWTFSLDKNGNNRWKFQSGDEGGSFSSLAFTTDYSHVIIAERKTIYSRETSTGNLSWEYTFNMNADFRATPAVDDNNVIYIGSHGDGDDNDESTLYALKADGSGIIWQYNLGSDMYSSPVLGNDKVLYVGSEGHGNTGNKLDRFHAFNMSDGKLLWSVQLANDVTWGSAALSEVGILYVSSSYNSGNEVSGLYAFRSGATGLLPDCGSPTFQESNAHTGRR
jgi:hypothetical protein